MSKYLTITFVLMLCVLGVSGASAATMPDGNFWTTNGPVFAFETNFDKQQLYVGGNFSRVGPFNGPFAAFDDAAGKQLTLPKTNGAVHAVVPDGAGGIYVAGEFTRIGNVIQPHLAHVVPGANGLDIDKSFTPEINAPVVALARGDLLYIAGQFTQVNTLDQPYIAALNPDGSLNAPWADTLDGDVTAMMLSGGRLIVGGSFTHAGTAVRNRLAAFTAAGALDAWDPNLAFDPSTSFRINGIARHVQQIVIGGNFTFTASKSYRHLIAVDTSTGQLNTAWSPNPNGPVYSVHGGSGSFFYVGGAFTSLVNGTGQQINQAYLTHFMAYSLVGGSGSVTTIIDPPLPLAVSVDAPVYSITERVNTRTVLSNYTRIDDGVLYIGGNFSSARYTDPVSGNAVIEPRLGAAAIRIADNSLPDLTAWHPPALDNVRYVGAVDMDPGTTTNFTIFAGGGFTIVGGLDRANLAAFDFSTGQATSWNPDPNGPVYDLKLIDLDNLIVGGDFRLIDSIDNVLNLAKIRTSLRSRIQPQLVDAKWTPNPISAVRTIDFQRKNGLLFIGGDFPRFADGTVAGHIGVVDYGTGVPVAWNGIADATVNALVLDAGSKYVYAAGPFALLNGIGHTGIGRFELTGKLDPWTFNANDAVNSIALTPDDLFIYAAGKFSQIGNEVLAISKLSTNIGVPLPESWGVKQACSRITDVCVNAQTATISLEPNGHTLYAGGNFRWLDKNNHPFGAALFANDVPGALPTWEPSPVRFYLPVASKITTRRHAATFSDDILLFYGKRHAGFDFYRLVPTPAILTTTPAPPAGNVFTVSPVTVNFGCPKIGGDRACRDIWYSVDNSAVKPGISPAYSGPLTVNNNGNHTIRYLACTREGSCETEKSYTFTLNDTQAPPVTITAPAANAFIASTSVTVSGTSDPGVTVQLTEVGNLGSALTDNNGNWSITLSNLSDAGHTVTATVSDPAGNSASASVMFTVDTVAPTISITTPVADALVNSQDVNVAGITEPGLDVSIDQGNTHYGTVTADANGAWQFLVSGLTETTHHLSATTADQAGNTATATVSFTVDTTRPVVAISSPNAGALLNTSSVTITGTTEAGLNVAITDNTTTLGGVTADAGGVWQYDASGLADGQHTVVATVVDGANNSATATVRFAVDTQAPALNIASPADNATLNSANLTLNGTTEPNLVVSIKDNGLPLGSVPAGGAGAWSYNATALADGDHLLEATVSDAAGNPASASITVHIDTQAPSILISDPVNGAQLNQSTVSMGGTTEPSLLVRIVENSIELGRVTANATGVWRYAVPGLADGTHTVHVETADTAGNPGTASVVFVVDTLVPDIAITSPVAGAVINQSDVSIGGTVEAGLAVQISDNAQFLGTVTGDNAGNWTFTASGLAEGGHTIGAATTDAAGNNNNASLGFSVDTVAPAIQISSPGEGALINVNTVPVVGTTQAGLTVEVYDGASLLGSTLSAAGGDWSFTANGLLDGDHGLRAHTQDAAGNPADARVSIRVDTQPPVINFTQPADNALLNTTAVPFSGTTESNISVELRKGGSLIATTTAGPGGQWTFNVSGLNDGVHTYRAIAIDAAGNSHFVDKTFTIDTTAPILNITVPAQGSILNTANVAISGSTEPGLVVTFFENGANLGSTTADGVGNWSSTVAALADGSHTIEARTLDGADNPSNASVDFTVDTVVPNVVISTPAADAVLADASVSLSGSTEPGLTVRILSAQPNLLGQTQADGAGNWNLILALANGPHVLTASVDDAAGNTGSAAVRFSIDTVNPALTITSPTSGAQLNSTTVQFNGSSEPGLTVQIVDNGAAPVGAGVDSGGLWRYTATGLSQGLHTIDFSVADSAGNSTNSSIGITIDTLAPALLINDPVDGSLFNNRNIVMQGTTDAGLTVQLRESGNALGSALADGTGVWRITLNGLAESAHTIDANVMDLAGNGASASVSFTIDITAPSIAISSPVSGAFLNSNDVPIAGVTEGGLTVELSENGSLLGSATALANGQWQTTLTGLAAGPHTLTAMVIDGAGNNGQTSVGFTVDTVAPPLTISNPSANAFINATTVTIAGQSLAGLTVVVKEGAAELGSVVVAADDGWSLDVSGFGEAMHNLSAEASDLAGNQTIALVSFTVDITKPAISIVSPVENDLVNATSLALTGTTEPGLIVSVSVDAGAAVAATANGSGDWSVTLTGLSEAQHSITANVTDAAGNTNSDAVSVTVDLTKPLLSIDSPSADSNINQTGVTLSGTTDPSLTVSMRDNGIALGSVSADAGGHWSFTASGLNEGEHRFVASTRDGAGNTAEAAVRIVVDTVAPVMRIESPVSGSYNHSGSIAFSGQSEPGLTVQLSETGALGSSQANAGGQWQININGVSDGEHRFTATTNDAAGNSRSAQVTVTVDTQPPAIVINAPGANTFINQSALTFSGDGEAGLTIQFSLDGNGIGSTTVDGGGQWIFDASGIAEGQHSVTATVGDLAGNSVSATRSFVIDTAIPVVQIQSPVPDSVIRQSAVDFTGLTEANSRVEFFDGSDLLGSVSADAGGRWAFTSGPLADGVHQFSVVAVDLAGNTSTARDQLGNITIDGSNDPPVATPTQALLVQAGASLSGILAGSDIDGDTLSFGIVTQPTQGNIELTESTGAFVYTPDNGASGSDTFTFVVSDGELQSAQQTVNIAINAQPSAPGLLAPDDGATGVSPAQVDFQWRESVDPDGDGIRYDFYLCEQQSFKSCDATEVAWWSDTRVLAAGMGPGALLLWLLIGGGRVRRQRLLVLLVAVMVLAGCNSKGGGNKNPEPQVQERNGIHHRVEGLKSNTTYFWKVIARDDRGGQAASEIWSFTTGS